MPECDNKATLWPESCHRFINTWYVELLFSRLGNDRSSEEAASAIVVGE